MRVDVVTIFPEALGYLDLSLLGKARERGLLDVRVHDLRDYTHDVHRSVDDAPYGGGPGMVMRPEPWGEALEDIIGEPAAGDAPLLVMPTPAGRPFTSADASRWAGLPWLVIGCGRYEGIDHRVVTDAARRMPVEEVSLGDYVLAGGELAALVLIEAVARLLPGFMGNAESAPDDSFSLADGLLEAPAYTRPPSWRELEVPEVLRSGDHSRIAAWRREQSLARTRAYRPELLEPPSP